MGKAVQKEQAQAIRDGHRLPKSPHSQDVRWGLVRMGLRGSRQVACEKGRSAGSQQLMPP